MGFRWALGFCTAIVALAVSAAVGFASGTSERVSGRGVGALKLGEPYNTAHAAGLVGPIVRGCELAGPTARSARLKAPLTGFVNFALVGSRKITEIYVTKGASAKGVGIGSPLAAIKRAFPLAYVDRSTNKTFGVITVTVQKGEGGPFMFAVGAKSQKVQGIGVPYIPFCD